MSCLKVVIPTFCHQRYPQISVDKTWRETRAMTTSGSALKFTRESLVVSTVSFARDYKYKLKLVQYEAQVVLSQTIVQCGPSFSVLEICVCDMYILCFMKTEEKYSYVFTNWQRVFVLALCHSLSKGKFLPLFKDKAVAWKTCRHGVDAEFWNTFCYSPTLAM